MDSEYYYGRQVIRNPLLEPLSSSSSLLLVRALGRKLYFIFEIEYFYKYIIYVALSSVKMLYVCTMMFMFLFYYFALLFFSVCSSSF